MSYLISAAVTKSTYTIGKYLIDVTLNVNSGSNCYPLGFFVNQCRDRAPLWLNSVVRVCDQH